MVRFNVRSFGLVGAVCLAFAAGPAMAQEQGWPLQGRGGNSYSSQPARAYYYAPARFAAPVATTPVLPAAMSTLIEVRLPTSAKLSFNGVATTPKGMVRNFVASSLVAGQQYTYAVRAEWNDGTRNVEQTRNVTFVGGQPLNIDFTQPTTLVNQ
jgi:uncharacterized protein (TIGR03000 family)